MATEVEVKRWCDVHLGRDDVKVGGQAVTVTLTGPWDVPGWDLDLCEDCTTALLEPLAAALMAYGVKGEVQSPKAKSKPATRRPALTGVNDLSYLVAAAQDGSRRGQKPEAERTFPCPWCPLDYASATSLKGHAMTKHGAPGSLEDMTSTCPLCGQGGIGSLSGHVVRAHPGIASNGWAALKVAAAQGDPYQVVEGVLSQGTNRA